MTRWATAVLVVAALAVVGGCGGDSNDSGPAGTPAQPVADVQGQFVDVVRTVSPQVVQIRTARALGSGIVFDRQGNVVTNAHVVGSSRSFTVTLASGKRDTATLVGAYVPGDLAVVRLADARPKPATFADSSKIAVGQFALAIGNPLGLQSSVTQGIVSSVGRTVSEGNGVTLPSVIQTSAEINPGNSGGALVDIQGRVIGIPTLAATDPEFNGAPAPGIGFAIPSSTVKSVAGKLVSSGRMPRSGRAFLGVEVTTIVGGGVLVRGVQKGGPAADAGIQPGDVIVSVAGTPTPTADDLTNVLATLAPGQKVEVKLARPNGAATVTVTLGAQPGG